ncbi:hypothetical protein ACRYCC_22295 [Actinomadura scrupuli]|uniref:hypothetical protein n=1 Tax=Actinomadura scrupuli TaxID=559629 RepID=UPI003D9920CA
MKHVRATCVAVLMATMTLTGCGGKSAKVSGSQTGLSASASRPGAAASGATTVPGTVRTGAYCSVPNAVGRTTDGTMARCVAKRGQTRRHWVVVPGSATGARAGEFCKPQGGTAKAPDGRTLTCTKKHGEHQARWRRK